jgi:magnesium transporter
MSALNQYDTADNNNQIPTLVPPLQNTNNNNNTGGFNRPSSFNEDSDSSHGDSEEDDDDDDNEFDEMEGREWIDLPFELQCVDAVLFVVGTMLTVETAELQNLAKDCINKLLSNDTGGVNDDHPLTRIRALKDSVSEMNSRVKGFVQSMNRILDEDEDMALMNLSRLLTHPQRFIQPVPPEVLEEESDEPELILEANLQVALSLQNSLDLVKGQIETASELIDQKLDALRNRLLFANMLIMIVTLAITAASVVGSFMGMNLLNYMEDSPHAFRNVITGSLFGALGLVIGIIFLLMYSGTIPKSSFRGM